MIDRYEISGIIADPDQIVGILKEITIPLFAGA
jgi:hypothetical protein